MPAPPRDFVIPDAERQITIAAHDHVLTNINCWSRDGRWLAYDIRSGDSSQFDGDLIEAVDMETGRILRLYHSRDGACCGVVTFHPALDRVVFILGPENPSGVWNYGFSRRHGVIVDINQPMKALPMDAMNYAPPFTPGALRGGSHVHVYSPDGQWLSFTYDDEILTRRDEKERGQKNAVPTAARDRNQRNVAVAAPFGPVHVARNHPRNHDGSFFCAVVTRTVNEPRPGSDEISRAFEEGWIGEDGYNRADGRRQRRALAFQGLVTAASGSRHAEVFVVDIPDDITRPGDAPLYGTATRRPAPPAGTAQRRLTFTDSRKFPGVAAAPRHWLRSSPAGTQIAFLMKDDDGVTQLWTILPNGGEPRQVTRLPHDIASAFSWNCDGTRIAAVIDGSVCVIDVASGDTARLTPRRDPSDAPSELACVFSPDGTQIAFLRHVMYQGNGYNQIFTVRVPEQTRPLPDFHANP
ncbi:hypothetical protein AW736_05940 [Termitidicoccus mucosus]|uniref:Biopolymer transporter Tol n=1 Tax=Termitidicoccus mucosus TaxID=1184151 RepID=A0A178INS0_9BACT|nr:hypothetical protein AW736_05940 [Opitutaceae bacterium TSB47]